MRFFFVSPLTLSENISDIQDKDRFDIVLANPPFGGKERAGVIIKNLTFIGVYLC